MYKNPITAVLLIIAGVLILAGNLFKMQHWPYGELMERIGFVSFFFIGTYEIRRLHRVIKALTSGAPDEQQ